MSTYLVALAVSDFATLKSADGKLAVWARPTAVNDARYALSALEAFVKILETNLGHKYQLPKLDMIAVPDMGVGAMENWGLITYKETYMLYDEGNVSLSEKQGIANTIAHELAHQWFGNFVSPQWWKYLWLNEGFATYFGFVVSGSVSINGKMKLNN